jgi:hypothetical protein
MDVLTEVDKTVLEAIYPQQPNSPIVAGDKVAVVEDVTSDAETEWYEVVSFWYNKRKDQLRKLNRLSEKHDYVYLESAGKPLELSYSECRSFPRCQDGKRTPLRFRTGRARRLDSLKRERFEHFVKSGLQRKGRRIPVWDIIMKPIRSLGFDVWLAGGSVRDVLMEDARNPVNPHDIDLAGTAPFGVFYEILEMNGIFRDFNLGGRLNKDGHVLIIYDASTREEPRIVEYAHIKYLKLRTDGLFQFDNEPSHDGVWRDLSINSLLYDSFEGVVFDLTDSGFEDLVGPVLRVNNMPPHPCPEKWVASRLIRLLKFAERFPNAILAPDQNFFASPLFEECYNAFLALDKQGRKEMVNAFYGENLHLDPSWSKIKATCVRLGIEHVWKELFEALL